MRGTSPGRTGRPVASNRRPVVPCRRLLLPILLMSACAQVPLSPEAAARLCEDRARAAQAPTGSVSVGVNSDSGAFGGIAIGVTDDYLRGRDPVEVYETCVIDRSGQPPYRAPVLRP